jgi:ASC-1-like (ASCH) protein
MEKDEGSEDGISELIADMCKGEVLGGDVFEFVKEQLNYKVSPTSKYTQFTFVVKLLHIKFFHQINNFTFDAMMKVLEKAFPDVA